MTAAIFRFDFEGRYRLPAAVLGIRDGTASVTVSDDDRLDARFGRWSLTTDLANIVSVSVAGPYGYLKTVGPAHLSLSDRGLTFATNSRRGVCLCFAEPVSGIDPFGLIKHPNLTVTVADCAGLAATVQRRAGLT